MKPNVVDSSTQTDIDMLSMNKLIESYEIFTPTATTNTTPDRLQKHNSIDMADATCESEYQTSMAPDVVEENDVDPVNETVHPVTEMDDRSVDEFVAETSETVPLADKVEEEVCSSECSGSTNVTADENNNVESVETRLNDHGDEESSSGLDSLSEDKKKSPVNLFVANIIEYGRSDASSDSDADAQRLKDESRRLSFTRSRRKRQQRKSRHQDDIGESDEVDRHDEQNKSDTDSKSSDKSIVRRRRIGVSAEPVRVSWSTLRESFKKLQLNSTLQDIEQEQSAGEEIIQGRFVFIFFSYPNHSFKRYLAVPFVFLLFKSSILSILQGFA